MNHEDGKFLGEHTLDVVGVAEERFPGCKLIAVQTTVVVKYKGKVRFLNVTKERE